jgi:hypothetical protein
MLRALLTLALCSSCTFTHATISRHDNAPSVTLSPAMQRLADRQSQTPLYCALTDTALVLGGFMAGPLASNHLPSSQVQPLNLLGLSVSGLTLVSLGVTIGAWGHL